MAAGGAIRKVVTYLANEKLTLTKVESQAKNSTLPEVSSWRGFYFDRKIVDDGTWAALPPKGRAVHVVYCYHANKAGVCWPGEVKVAKGAGISERHVPAAAAALENYGLLLADGETKLYHNRARLRVVARLHSRDSFPFSFGLLSSWGRLPKDAKALDIVFRAKVFEKHVTAFWAEENRDLRRNIYLAGDDESAVKDLLAGEYYDRERQYDLKPYVELTTRTRREYATLAGIKDTNHYRRDKRIDTARTALDAAGRVKTIGNLIFLLKEPKTWGK